MNKEVILSNEINNIDPDVAPLVPQFLKHREEELAELKGYFERKDYNEIKFHAHSWKGVCGSYGFHQLSSLSEQLEKAAESKDNLSIDNVLHDMNFYVENAKKHFN